MINKLKKSLLFIFVLLLSVLNIGQIKVLASSDYSDGKDIELELKDVDLKSYETAKKIDIIYFAEKGFLTDSYSLTLYVYNYGQQLLSENTGSNVINLGYRFNDKNEVTEYGNFKLKFISKTNDNLIYKFSVLDRNEILYYAFRNQNSMTGKRVYSIAGIQLLLAGTNLAKDYTIGAKYIYSGYENDVGIGISHKVESLKSISLDVNYVWYRTDGSDNGKYHQNQVSSVYFSVPEEYFNDNRSLTGVKAEWYEYKTQPIVVLENQEKYKVLKDYVGKDIGKYNKDLTYFAPNNPNAVLSLTYGQNLSTTETTSTLSYDWGYNVNVSDSYATLNYVSVKNHETSLYYLFTTNGISYKDFTLKNSALKQYIYGYNNSAVKGYLPIKNGNVSADLFLDSVDKGRTMGYNEKIIRCEDTFDLLSYNENHDFFDTVWDYGFLAWLMKEYPTEESRKNITPIYQIDLANDFKNIDSADYNLCVDSSFLYELYDYAKLKNKNNERTFLFRFANTDYFSVPLDLADGYVAQETVFLDFDVIHLEFSNKDEILIIPVVASPIDGVGDITPPKDFTYDKGWLLYAFIGLCLSVLGIFVYSLFKKESK